MTVRPPHRWTIAKLLTDGKPRTAREIAAESKIELATTKVVIANMLRDGIARVAGTINGEKTARIYTLANGAATSAPAPTVVDARAIAHLGSIFTVGNATKNTP